MTTRGSDDESTMAGGDESTVGGEDGGSEDAGRGDGGRVDGKSGDAGHMNATKDEVVTLAHGAGGSSSRSLIEDLVLSRFDGTDGDSDGAIDSDTTSEIGLPELDDGSVHSLGEAGSLVVTTDSHVVKPPFFPGGDVGKLAIAGTVNDLAVMGATEPLALTSSLVLEEGFPISRLERVLDSMVSTCREAGATITTGDTKVMGRGEVDGIVITTTGVALVPQGEAVSDAGLRPGDALVVSSTVGDHGIALLAEREGFDFGGGLESDVAPLNGLVRKALDAGAVTAMKDPTRGGLATALVEMATKADVGLALAEPDVPVDDATAAAGEILGIDPLTIANEGVVVFGVDPDDVDAVLAAVRSHPLGGDAAVIGHAVDNHTGRVVLDTGFGRRYLTEPEGETLPRIC